MNSNIKLKKRNRIICAFLAFSLCLCSFINFSVVTYASELTEDTEIEVILEKMSNEFQYVYENAVKVDNNGYIEAVNINLLREHYGNNILFDEYEQASTIQTRSFGDYVKCVANGLAVSAGINELKTAFNGKVIKALKSGAWKKASKLIFDNLAKKLGKKTATFLLKKAVGAVLPSSLAGMLIWNATKCTPKLLS